MSTLITVITILSLALAGLMVALQIAIRLRARALRGTPAPAVGGPLGKRIARGKTALVYFHSPTCGACRPFTPRLQAMARANPAVHVVDVAQQLDVARAFGVLTTPSTVEIADGRIVDCRVGAPSRELLGRFA